MRNIIILLLLPFLCKSQSEDLRRNTKVFSEDSTDLLNFIIFTDNSLLVQDIKGNSFMEHIMKYESVGGEFEPIKETLTLKNNHILTLYRSHITKKIIAYRYIHPNYLILNKYSNEENLRWIEKFKLK